MTPDPYRLTPIAELEPHRFFQIPERTFLEHSPHVGTIAFSRDTAVSKHFPYVPYSDARGRETSARVDLVAPDGRSQSLPCPITRHSPTGLEWGYGGSGPADCAANILALFVSLPEAWRLHQKFKTWVAGIPQEGGEMSIRSVRLWIEETWQREQADPEQMHDEAAMLELARQINQEEVTR